MVEPVVRYLNGKGHRMLRARDLGLANAEDADLVEYALYNELIIVTFDPDLRDSSLRGGCQCLHIRPRESTARERLKGCYADVVAALRAGSKLVTIDAKGALATA
jgi:predicted nuclease of predicted toxin-antitoxin system